MPVTIDQTWIDANKTSDGVLELVTQDETYNLSTDFAADYTAFNVLNTGITLDIQGNAVTYDNVADPGWVDEDFSTGWTMSGDFSLFTPSAADDWRWVWPEDAKTSCAISFPTSSSDESLVADNTVGLILNNWYVAVFHMRSQAGAGVSYDLDIYNGTFTYTATRTGNYSFMRPLKVVFQAEATDDFNVSISVRDGEAVAAHTGYISNVIIRNLGCHGIVTSPSVGGGGIPSHQKWQKITEQNTPRADNFIVKDSVGGGSIKQAGKSYFSHCVYNYQANPCTVQDIELYVRGPMCRTYWTTATSGTENQNNGTDIISKGRMEHLEDRSNHDGVAVGGSYNGDYTNVTVWDRAQTGIRVEADDTVDGCHVYGGARIQHTNDAAVMFLGADGGTVKNCVLDATIGGGRGRGIRLQTTASPTNNTTISNCAITAQEFNRNNEYGGCVLDGAKALDIENDVHKLRIDASAGSNNIARIQGHCGGHALNLRVDDSFSDIVVEDWNFEGMAIAAGDDWCHAVSISRTGEPVGGQNSDITFQRNCIKSNSRLLGKMFDMATDQLIFSDCAWWYVNDGIHSFKTWGLANNATVSSVVIRNPYWVTAETKTTFKADLVTEDGADVIAGAKYTVDHTVTVRYVERGIPKASLSVTVTDEATNPVAGSPFTTDANGEFTTNLKEWQYLETDVPRVTDLAQHTFAPSGYASHMETITKKDTIVHELDATFSPQIRVVR